MYAFEWWWIFPLICVIMMILCAILFFKNKGGFCRPQERWFFDKDRVERLEKEIEELKKRDVKENQSE